MDEFGKHSHKTGMHIPLLKVEPCPHGFNPSHDLPDRELAAAKDVGPGQRTLARDALAVSRKYFGNIDLLYYTVNLMKDSSFIVNRIWCNTPEGATAERSYFPALLWRAHAFEPLRAIKRRLRELPR